jgi:transglutaminase-like putative cysteine protease
MAELPGRIRGMRWVIASLAVALVPHIPFVPAWISLLLVAALAWRGTADVRGWPLPPRWLRVAVVTVATLAVFASYGTLNGIEAGTSFLALMAGVKLLETRSSRDLTVLVFIAWFLLYAALLRDQRLAQLPWLLASAVVTTAALMRVHAGSAGDAWHDVLRRTASLLAQALPLAAALFLLFPRLPGPFWGIEEGESARMGLSDEMTPGDVSDLTVSGDVAFRVRFAASMPPHAARYWRGPVLHEFDGRSWRRPRGQTFPAQDVRFAGAPVDYQITLEPHGRHWVLALDLPAAWSPLEATQSYDFTLLSPRAINDVTAYRLRSYTKYTAGTVLPLSLRHKDLSLPSSGNRRSLALGRALAARNTEPQGVVRDMLQMFRSQPFVYTMQPPRLADDAVDEFLFSTRRGFCEHYASAFTLVMRAAGIPARVVTGYQGGDFNPYGGYLIVRQSDAHAWSEVWIDGRGWLRVDPTAAVAPERIEKGLIDAVGADEPVPGRLREASALWARVAFGWDTVNDFWNQRFLRFNTASQFDLLERLGIREADWRSLVLGLAASLALFFVALSAYLGWTLRDPARDWPARLHEITIRRLRKRGLRPAPSEGPVAFLDRAATACPDLGARIRDIRYLYVALRYGPSPTAADLRRLKYLVNGLRP